MGKKLFFFTNNKRLNIIIVIAIIILAITVAFMSYLNIGSRPLDSQDSTLITVEVPNGTNTHEIGKILESKGLISNYGLFILKSKLEGLDGKYKAGQYHLSPSMSMDEIIENLISGNNSSIKFTIPEGFNISKIIEVFEKKGLINKETFTREIISGQYDYWFLKDAPSGKNRLEGYLYPETYYVYSNATEHEIIDKMLSQFNVVFTKEHRKRAEELGMNINEVITLASIIEREAVMSEERPIISGVFHNRLKSGMPLQSCATVQYLLGEQKAVLTIADTQIESPYNTYLVSGLPPGPICSPGIESINAALWPADTDYLYFVAKGDGSHAFAVTFEEHKKYKAMYID